MPNTTPIPPSFSRAPRSRPPATPESQSRRATPVSTPAAQLPRRIIITGTGRAGTTFLVELLTALGLDTGYGEAAARAQAYHQHCYAGLEQKDIEEPGAPRIVKDPALCETLPEILRRGRIAIQHAIVPLRALEDAARSRIRVGGEGETPGGLVGTADAAQQADVLARRFHGLVHTLVAHEIPHTFLEFPRFARDARYTYEKLHWLVGDLGWERFAVAFAQTARPERIHSFVTPDAAAKPAEAGAPAREFALAQRARRFRRRFRRGLALAAVVAAIFAGFAGEWLLERSGGGTASAATHEEAAP